MAVFAQGPLRQVVGIPIVVDKVTGETTIQQRLSVESVP
jgi:type IV secretion system protein VirB8